MFLHVTDAKYIADYRVWLKFNNHKKGEVDLAKEVSWGEVFEPLRDQNYFKNFKIENDTLSWENGADLAPESLYELLIQQNKKKK
jgi:hypothetical protein